MLPGRDEHSPGRLAGADPEPADPAERQVSVRRASQQGAENSSGEMLQLQKPRVSHIIKGLHKHSFSDQLIVRKS